MSGLLNAIRRSLAIKVSLILAVVMLILVAIMAFYVTNQQVAAYEEMALAKARLSSQLGAQMYSTVLEEAIDNGALTTPEAFDQNYVAIAGYDWGKNPKYHTAYDSITDKAVLPVQDRFLDDEDFVYAVGCDSNGYIPTHNGLFQKPLLGNDANANRTKRIFNDPVGIAAAKNTEIGHREVYKRDTGEIMWDVSTPIIVKGKHWGGFRIGVSIAKIEAKKAALLTSLLVLFGIFAAVVIAMIFIMIKRSMKPVEMLTTKADAISTGEALEDPIKPNTIDEIGRLTKSLDRLRNSMKAAMERLGEG